MGEVLAGRGQIAVVAALTGQGLEIRKTGFQAILEEKYPEIQIVARIEGKGSSEKVYTQLITAFKLHPDLAGIYVVDGNTPAVVVRALTDTGRAGKIKVVCHDLVDDTMRALQNGMVSATISQDPYAQGHDPVIYLYNYLVAGQLPPRAKMTTPMDRITRENIQHYWDPQHGVIENSATQARRARPVDQMPGRPLRIIFLGREDSPFFVPIKQGALSAAAELKDCNTLVEWYDPALPRGSRAYSAADYAPAIEAYRAKGYDGIVLPIYDPALVPYINRVVDAGVVVAVFNSEPDSLGGLMNTLTLQSQHLLDISLALSRSADESDQRTGQISTSIGEMNRALALEVQSAAQAIANTTQMAESVQQISQGAQEQTQAVDSVAEAIREISKAIEGTRHTAMISEQTASKAVQVAQQGANTIQQTLKQIEEMSTAVSEAVHKIQALNQLSRQIDSIVNTVNGIAEQTNMLALNANIEAARAGVEGRGFAVVATEIRGLAEQSKKSTKEIAALIRAVQANSSQMVETVNDAMQQAQAGSQLAAQASTALELLLKSAETMRGQTEKVVQANASVVQSLDHLTHANLLVTGVITENASATQQVSGNIQQTVEMVNHMSAISRENASAIENIHTRSNEVAAQSQGLKTSIAALVQMAEEMQGCSFQSW